MVGEAPDGGGSGSGARCWRTRAGGAGTVGVGERRPRRYGANVTGGVGAAAAEIAEGGAGDARGGWGP